MNNYSAYIWGAYLFTLLLMGVVLLAALWQASMVRKRVRFVVTSKLLDDNYETP